MFKQIIFLLLLIIFGCENANKMEVWRITDTNMKNTFLESAGFVKISKETIVFSNSSISISYPIIISDNKLLINTETQKYIFSIELQGNSNMVISEMYKKNPLIMKLSKNH